MELGQVEKNWLKFTDVCRNSIFLISPITQWRWVVSTLYIWETILEVK